MKALVTGASSGIGRDIARALVSRGWDVILVARRADRLMDLKKELGKHARCVRCDVSHIEECKKLYEVLQNDDEIQMLVNCAGFGLCGRFTELPLEDELKMIDTNLIAVHVLTKLFLQDFVKRNRGYILNVVIVIPLVNRKREDLSAHASGIADRVYFGIKMSAPEKGRIDVELIHHIFPQLVAGLTVHRQVEGTFIILKVIKGKTYIGVIDQGTKISFVFPAGGNHILIGVAFVDEVREVAHQEDLAVFRIFVKLFFDFRKEIRDLGNRIIHISLDDHGFQGLRVELVHLLGVLPEASPEDVIKRLF